MTLATVIVLPDPVTPRRSGTDPRGRAPASAPRLRAAGRRPVQRAPEDRIQPWASIKYNGGSGVCSGARQASMTEGSNGFRGFCGFCGSSGGFGKACGLAEIYPLWERRNCSTRSTHGKNPPNPLDPRNPFGPFVIDARGSRGARSGPPLQLSLARRSFRVTSVTPLTFRAALRIRWRCARFSTSTASAPVT